MCGRTHEQCDEKCGAGALLAESYHESHRPTSLTEETFVAGGEGVPRLVRHVKEWAKPKPLHLRLKCAANPVSVESKRQDLLQAIGATTSRFGRPPACATLVGMRRIVWSLLSAAARTCHGACRRAPVTRARGHHHPRTSHAHARRGAASSGRHASSARSPRAEPGSPRAWFGAGQELRGAGARGVPETADDGARLGVGGADHRRGPGQQRAIRPGAVALSGSAASRARRLAVSTRRSPTSTNGQGKTRVGGGRTCQGRGASARLRRRSVAECALPGRQVPRGGRGRRRRADAPSLYWTTRAYNALATEAFATLDTLPPSAEVHVVLASVHRDQGRPTEAVPELKAALALRPGDRAIEEELALGAVRIQESGRSAALAGTSCGLPRTARTDLAFFTATPCCRRSRWRPRCPTLKAAAAGQPEAIVVRASLGRALLQSGDAAAALPHLEAAAAGDDPQGDGATHYQLAQAYQRLGRADAGASGARGVSEATGRGAGTGAGADRRAESTPRVMADTSSGREHRRDPPASCMSS